MMFVTIDFSSNIEKVMMEYGWVFYNQVPFALGRTINTVTFQMLEQIRGESYNEAFEVRNRHFPRRLFRMTQMPLRGPEFKAFKKGQSGYLGADIYQSLDREWVDRQADGGIRRPRGNSLAIPSNESGMNLRSSNGRIRASNKPLRLEDGKRYYMVTKGGQKDILFKRLNKKKSVPVYYFRPKAKIEKRFNFIRDAEEVFHQHFDVTFDIMFKTAMQTARPPGAVV